MRVMYERVAGIDVHKDMIKVAIRFPGEKGTRKTEVLEFRTFWGVLQEVARELRRRGVTHVAMEASGVYTEPVYHALCEQDFTEVLVINPKHVKALKGHKTDARDCRRIAELLECGLLRGSYVPSAEQKEMRDLTRYRKKLVQARTSEIQRMQKALESAGIKLGSVLTDITGVSATAMIDALIDGERRPQVMADLARGTLRAAGKQADLKMALAGRFTGHHGQMVELHLARIDHLDQMLGQVTEKIGRVGKDPTPGLVDPFTAQVQLLMSIPGVGERVAAVVIWRDRRRHGQVPHRQTSAPRGPGSPPATTNPQANAARAATARATPTAASILIEAALAAAKTRSRIGARYHRLHRRFGGKQSPGAAKKAAFAVAHTLIKVIWSVLATGQPYTDLGHDYYTRRVDPQTQTRRLIAQLEALSGKKIVLVDSGGQPSAPD